MAALPFPCYGNRCWCWWAHSLGNYNVCRINSLAVKQQPWHFFHTQLGQPAQGYIGLVMLVNTAVDKKSFKSLKIESHCIWKGLNCSCLDGVLSCGLKTDIQRKCTFQSSVYSQPNHFFCLPVTERKWEHLCRKCYILSKRGAIFLNCWKILYYSILYITVISKWFLNFIASGHTFFKWKSIG